MSGFVAILDPAAPDDRPFILRPRDRVIALATGVVGGFVVVIVELVVQGVELAAGVPQALLGDPPAPALVKIDVEGFEDRILVPFFRDAPRSLWPKLLQVTLLSVSTSVQTAEGKLHKRLRNVISTRRICTNWICIT